MELKAKGLKRLTALSGIDKEIKAGIRYGLYNFADKVRKDVRQAILSKNKTGRTYIVRRGNRRYRHRASARGEAPANLTGNLRASVGYDVKGIDMAIGYREQSTKGKPVPYGARLEIELERNALEQEINKNSSDFKDFVKTGVHKKVVRKIQQGKIR